MYVTWKENSLYVALQNQIVDKVDDLSHCSLLSTLSPRWVSELDALSIAQKASSQEQIIDV